MESNKYLTEIQVAEMTGISLSTLRNNRCMGTGIMYSKLGSKSVRYSLSDVIDYVESRKILTDNTNIKQVTI